MTLYEKETIILFNEEEKFADVETANKALIKQLDELCIKRRDITLLGRDENFARYKITKRWVKVRAARELSSEKRQKLADMARRNFHNAEKEQNHGI